MVMAVNGMVNAGTLDSWVRTHPNYWWLAGVAASPDRVLVVGDSGTVFTSDDSQIWTSRNQDARIEFGSATFGNGKFVCLANADVDAGLSERVLLHSDDGAEWTRSQPPAPFGSVRFAKDRFFGLGPNGSIHSSTDGLEWTLRYSGQVNTALSDIVHGEDLFVAVGRQGPNQSGLVLTSPDGITWTSATQLPTDSEAPGYAAAYGNGAFVVTAGYDSYALRGGRYWWSADGYHWETRYLPGTGLVGVGFGNGTFVMVGDIGRVVSSPDGKNWTSQPSGQSQHLVGVVHTGSGFVAIASQGSSELVLSDDGKIWRPWDYSRGPWLDPNRILYEKDRFIAVGDNGEGVSDGEILLSSDGTRWVPADYPSRPRRLLGLTYGKERFVAVGLGQIWISTDSQNWRLATESIPRTLHDVVCDGEQFIAVGTDERDHGFSQAVILRSTDAESWYTAVDVSDLPGIYTVTHGDGLFVGLGRETALTSPDGMTWDRHPLSPRAYLRAAAHANGLFVAVGDGVIRTSTDGRSWSYQADRRFPSFRGIFWDGGRWIASGRGEDWTHTSTLWISEDGQQWVPQLWTRPMHAVAFGNGNYVAGGMNLYQSMPLLPRLTLERTNGSQPAIRLDATPQAHLTLERSTDLRNWTPWIDVLPTGSSVSLIDPSVGARQFYRARQNPAP